MGNLTGSDSIDIIDLMIQRSKELMRNPYFSKSKVNYLFEELQGGLEFIISRLAKLKKSIKSNEEQVELIQKDLEKIKRRSAEFGFFKGTILRGNVSGTSLLSLDNLVYKGQFQKSFLSGKGTIISSEYSIKGLFKEGKVKNKEIVVLHFPSKIQYHGLLKRSMKEMSLDNIIIKSFRKGKVFARAHSHFSLNSEMMGEGTMIFRNGSLAGFVKNYVFAVDSQNEGKTIEFGGKTFFIRAISSKGEIFTDPLSVFSIDYERAVIESLNSRKE